MSLWKYYSNINLEKIRKGINSMLYCAAKIDENNVVIDTIVVDESDISDENGLSDSLTTSFANSIKQTTGTWKWAGMYQEGTADTRKICPGIGDNWDTNTSKFYQKKPHNSWVLDSNLNWNPPIPKPNETTKWIWNEEIQSWELPEQAFEIAPEYNETELEPDNENYIGRVGE
jgi:hypothetical protein